VCDEYSKRIKALQIERDEFEKVAEQLRNDFKAVTMQLVECNKIRHGV